jgi:hypothetical protein
MGIELQSETRIVVGRLCDPTDPERPWWWQSSTKVDGVDLTVAGFAATENDAILEAAARTIDLHAAIDAQPSTASPSAVRPPEPDFWGLNGDRAEPRVLDPERSASG